MSANAGAIQGKFNLAWSYNSAMGTSRNTAAAARLFLEVFRSGVDTEFYKKVLIDFKSSLHRQTVRQLQSLLRQSGHYKGSIDGKFGPGTRRAIEAYGKP